LFCDVSLVHITCITSICPGKRVLAVFELLVLLYLMFISCRKYTAKPAITEVIPKLKLKSFKNENDTEAEIISFKSIHKWN